MTEGIFKNAWEPPAAPPDPIGDMRRAVERVKVADHRPPSGGVHHPRCRAVETQEWADCTCGGAAYR